MTFLLGSSVKFLALIYTPYFGAITIDEGRIKYGFMKAGAFVFEADFNITNRGLLKITLYNSSVSMYVFDIVIYSSPLESVVEIPRKGTYFFEISDLVCTDFYDEIWAAFHHAEDNMFDFKLVLSAWASYGIYEGPFEVYWNMKLGFIHYP